MRATELAQRLSREVEEVVRILLPNGKRARQEWEVGSVAGEAGESLKVHLSGDKAGVWSDFSTGQTGDLIGLWMAVRNLSLFEACKEAMDHLGIVEQRIENPRPAYRQPDRQGVHKLSQAHADWLTQVRKIPQETIAAFRLASRDTNGGNALMFPYLRNGELIAAKYRAAPEKKFWAEGNTEPCLFGWQAMPPQARSVILCEGELDAMAYHAYGLHALSVPFGGGGKGKQQWVENEFDRLALFDAIFLSMDMDKAGQEATVDLVQRLGAERCRIVNLPKKDANDCLIEGVPRETMIAAMREAKTMDPSELHRASDYENEVVAQFTEGTNYGMELPWKKTWDFIRLRLGEVSVWAGVNGHGKSGVVGHVTGYEISRGSRACVASMEFKPARWLKRMFRQIAGRSDPSEQFIRHISRWTNERLWVFEAVGTAKASKILEVFRYAAKRYGIDLFIIDNLAKCGFGEDDYNAQKNFVDDLTDFAKEFNVHVALVHHMKKGESEEKPNGKMGVKGTGAITDMVDTVIEVWRNKKKEKKVEQLRAEAERNGSKAEIPTETLEDPDAILFCHKQRNGEHEPTIALWFDRDSHQYLSKHDYRARPIVDMTMLRDAA